MHVNDLLTSISCSARLYADDTCLVLHDNDVSQLEQKINLESRKLKTWLDSDKLTMDIKKLLACLFNPLLNSNLYNLIFPYVMNKYY